MFWFHLFKDCIVLLEFLFIFPSVGLVIDFLYLFWQMNSVGKNLSHLDFYNLLILDFHREALKKQHILGMTPSLLFLPPVIRLKYVTTQLLDKHTLASP